MKIQNIQREAEEKRTTSYLDPMQLPPTTILPITQPSALGQPAAPAPFPATFPTPFQPLTLGEPAAPAPFPAKDKQD